MESFKALQLHKSDSGPDVRWVDLTKDDLMEGDALVRVSHSTINYKDGLAITGKAPVVRKWPMIPGIDFCGTIVESGSPEFSNGDEVILNGWGLGETHFGGYAQYARVKSDWLVHKPDGFTPAETMAIGTAGYTAMLCVLALEKNGVSPSDGQVLVTGASGGVGSVAVALLAKLGYQVVASTGRSEETPFLNSLGAAEVIDRAEFSGAPKPLSKERWAGAIDVAGSGTLANIISQLQYGGTVAACGLAQGMDLPASVAPFILRGVTLAGVDSVMVPKERRIVAWNRLEADLDRDKLAELTQTFPLNKVVELAPKILAGQVRGRVVLKID